MICAGGDVLKCTRGEGLHSMQGGAATQRWCIRERARQRDKDATARGYSKRRSCDQVRGGVDAIFLQPVPGLRTLGIHQEETRYLMRTIRWPGVSDEGACFCYMLGAVESEDLNGCVECDGVDVSPVEIGSVRKVEKVMAQKRTY